MVTTTHNDLNKFRNLQQNLDHAYSQFYDICCNSNPSLQEYLKALDHESQSDWNIVSQEVLHINDKMKSIRSKVSSLDASMTISLMKSELFALKDAIEIFKQTHKARLRKLLERERLLAEEVCTYEQLYENWATPVDVVEERTFVRQLQQQPKSEAPEVKEFTRFLHENKGHTNGWSWGDHSMFLKMKAKFKTKDKVTENLLRVFPDKTAADIEQHYNWHEKYCVLRDKQRDAIRVWKVQKQSMGPIDMEALKVPTNKPKKLPLAKDTKERLRLWKEEKMQREKREMQSKESHLHNFKELEMLKFQKNSELKEKVEKWRTSKEAEKRAVELKQREEERKTRAFRAMIANHFIRDFQKQDMAYMQKRCVKRKSENKLPLPGKAVSARDPERLLKPTKTWISRISTKEEKPMRELRGLTNVNLNTIQKLKAADWRK